MGGGEYEQVKAYVRGKALTIAVSQLDAQSLLLTWHKDTAVQSPAVVVCGILELKAWGGGLQRMASPWFCTSLSCLLFSLPFSLNLLPIFWIYPYLSSSHIYLIRFIVFKYSLIVAYTIKLVQVKLVLCCKLLLDPLQWPCHRASSYLFDWLMFPLFQFLPCALETWDICYDNCIRAALLCCCYPLFTRASVCVCS